MCTHAALFDDCAVIMVAGLFFQFRQRLSSFTSPVTSVSWWYMFHVLFCIHGMEKLQHCTRFYRGKQEVQPLWRKGTSISRLSSSCCGREESVLCFSERQMQARGRVSLCARGILSDVINPEYSIASVWET